jgi:formylglycine-generating enzyme required for sulfatase activity
MVPDSSLLAFLSHNSADKPAVEELQRRLFKCAPPIECWLDKDDLRSSDTWFSQIEGVIASCEAAMIFYGPNGFGKVHRREAELLIDRAMREAETFRVIPVLLPGAQLSDVSGFAKLYNWVDFRSGLDAPAPFGRLVAFLRGEAPRTVEAADRIDDSIQPYRGLERFDGEHARYFFGRDKEIVDICGLVKTWPFVLVMGGSGSGKSSIVRAGLSTALASQELPFLKNAVWITVLPGANPLRSLAEQLSNALPREAGETPEARVDAFEARLRERPDGLVTLLNSRFPEESKKVLLFVDQFEELFTYGQEVHNAAVNARSQMEQFIGHLATVAESGRDRFRMLATLRADFLERSLDVSSVVSLVQYHSYMLGDLGSDALRGVIVKPAQQAGASFEKGLVARILTDVEGELGSLPLLQQALKELWNLRRGRWLTNEDYETTGGVAGALGKRADETYNKLTPTQQQIARNILLRLTNLGDGVADTRRRARIEEFYTAAVERTAINAVIRELSAPNARLIVTNKDGTAEVTHEALIRRWNLLATWLHSDREDLQLHRRLTVATSDWEETDRADPAYRDAAYLWDGGRLVLAEALNSEHPGLLNDQEQAFLTASLQERKRRADDKLAQARRIIRIMAIATGVCFVFGIIAVSYYVALVKQENATALKQAEELLIANSSDVPQILIDVRANKEAMKQIEDFKKTRFKKLEKIRVALALSQDEPEQAKFLLGQVIGEETDPAELYMLRDYLMKPPPGSMDELWGFVEHDPSPKKRIRSATALAKIDPKNPRWEALGPRIAVDLLAAEALELGVWSKAFEPVWQHLAGRLTQAFRGENDPNVRLKAAELLARYNRDSVEPLIALLPDANAAQFDLLFEAVHNAGKESVAGEKMNAVLDERSPPPTAKGAQFDELAGRKANALITLARLEQCGGLWSGLRGGPDPRLRTYLIQRVIAFKVPAQVSCDRLLVEDNPTARAAILQVLGKVTEDLPAGVLQSALLLYRNDPDAGVHSSARWMLTSHKKDAEVSAIDESLAGKSFGEDRGWFVNDHRQTFTVIRNPPDFEMGSAAPRQEIGSNPLAASRLGQTIPSAEDEPGRKSSETLHRQTIPRSFAISTREVSQREYMEFVQKYAKHPEIIGFDEPFRRDLKEFTSDDGPVLSVTWFQAAQYCRWLSEKENILEQQMCYPEVEDIKDGMKLPEHYLEHSGYRLPTEAEWEYACRAGAHTTYWFGTDVTLMPALVHFEGNSARSGLRRAATRGSYLPNGFGLFDMLGNVNEWVFDRNYSYDERMPNDGPQDEGKSVKDEDPRFYRGGGYTDLVQMLRSAYRDIARPTNRFPAIGFRVARTIPSRP